MASIFIQVLRTDSHIPKARVPRVFLTNRKLMANGKISTGDLEKYPSVMCLNFFMAFMLK